MEEHLGQLDLQDQPDLQESPLRQQPQSLMYLMNMIFASLSRLCGFAQVNQGTRDQGTHFATHGTHGCAKAKTFSLRHY